MGRIQSIQALRFIAAALVILCHAYPQAKFGAVGVDIFFVISGFIISRVMSGKSPREFLRARVVRIYPIYWVCAVPTALIAIHIGAATVPRTLTSITLWPVFGSEFLQPYLVLGWTLSFEMLFYACATLVLVDRRALWLLGLAYPLCLLGAFTTGAAVLRFVGNPLIAEFLMGVCIGSFASARKPATGVFAIAIAAVLIAASNADRLYLPANSFDLAAPDRVLAWGLPAAMLVWGFLQLNGAKWRLLPYLGDASYSIYLTHSTALLLLPFLPWPLRAAAAVAFGMGVFRYVERPLLNALKHRRSSTAEALAPSPHEEAVGNLGGKPVPVGHVHAR